jgi:ferredoxin-thioredoxin reductase catalytic subunit
MCKEFREQEEDGYCHCGLYFKEFEKTSDFWYTFNRGEEKW